MRPPAFARGRRAVAACLALLTVAALPGCATSEVAMDPVPITMPPSNGSLTWADEFDGASGTPPDTTKWGYDVGGVGWGNDELEYYSSSTDNAALDGQGHLVITSLEETKGYHVCWYGPCRYSSARLSTAGTFEQAYGTFEARIKLPSGRGLLPAFWMLGNDIHSVGWPANGEIDVVEYPGKPPAIIHGGVHGPGWDNGGTYQLPDRRAFSDDFHVYSVTWSPEAIAFAVDGMQYERQTREQMGPQKWVYDHPFFIVVNLAVGGKWPGSPDATGTAFPQQMIVDYVRVYAWHDNARPAANDAA